MAQRKKKPSGHQLEAIAHAQHRNEFLHKLKHFVNSVCGEDIYSHLPPKTLDRIYRLRFHSLTVVAAAGYLLPNPLLKAQKLFLSNWFKHTKLDLSKYGLIISLDDYLTVGLTVYSLVYLIHDHDFAAAPKVRSALLAYCSDEEPYSQMREQLFVIFHGLGMCLCTIEDGYFWLNYNPKLAVDGKSGMDNNIEVYLHLPESKRIKINGSIRPAMRLGWAHPFDGLDWVGMKPSSLGIKGSLSDDPMKVFVQSHALLRLAERIDSIDQGLAQYNMYDSFLNANVFYDSNHNLLIEYRIFGTKAGYFRVDVIDGVVAVRTFLFLTQSGTPEGVLLWKNTGLKMLDKKYLAIDKLSAFISSDIGQNEQVNKIFADSGCQSLFELYEKLGSICIKQSKQSNLARMLDYIGISDHHFPEDLTDITGCDNLSEPEKMSSEIAGIV